MYFDFIGVQYRLGDGGRNYGRVEVSVNKVWGTVCDWAWDNKDAGVLCRQFGFSDGYALRGAQYGQGSGPMWLSHLECTGEEEAIHQCPHRGFLSDPLDSSNIWWKCRSHKDDASVYCIDNCKYYF